MYVALERHGAGLLSTVSVKGHLITTAVAAGVTSSVVKHLDVSCLSMLTWQQLQCEAA